MVYPPFPRPVLSLTLIACLLSACDNRQTQTKSPPALPVQLQTLEPATVIDSNEFVGILIASEFVQLAPKIDGRILKIYADFGQLVKQGDPILLLEPTQQQEQVNAAQGNVNVQRANLSATEANLRSAEAQRDAAKANVASQQANVATQQANYANAQEVLKTREADLKRAQATLNLAEINLKRAKFLVETGVQPQQDLDNKTTAFKDSQANTEAAVKTVQAAKATVQANLGSVKAAQAALRQTQENLKAAEQQVSIARANIKAQKAAIDQAQGQLGVDAQQLIYNRVVSPINGTVGSITPKVGDFLRQGENFTTITDNRQFEMNINVPVERASVLRLGLPVEMVQPDGKGGKVGRISFVSPTADQNSQSILAKVVFANDGSLRNNQYVRVRIIWDQKPGLLVPTSAVTAIGAQRFVYVAEPAKTTEKSSNRLVARQKPVTLGGIQGQSYRILSGVASGEKIVLDRILELRDDLPITAAPVPEQKAVEQSL